MTKPPDLLSPEVRAAEVDVDSAFRANPLAGSSQATCLRAVLGHAEDRVWAAHLGGSSRTELQHGAQVDNVIYNMRTAVDWAYQLSTGVSVGSCDVEITDDVYGAAYDLWELALAYGDFCQAFSRGSRGEIALKLDGRRLVAEHTLLDDVRYEAYNLFLETRGISAVRENAHDPKHLHATEAIARSTFVDGGRFGILQPQKVVRTVRDCLRGRFGAKFDLPDDWALSQYSFGDFREVYLVLAAYAYMQWEARLLTLGETKALGVDGALFIRSKEWVLRNTLEACNVGEIPARAIVEDLIYGSRGQRQPDPALQPLLPLGEDLILSPALLLNSNPERNLCVLANRIPSERKIYDQLTGSKESLMTGRIDAAVRPVGLQFLGKRPVPCPAAPDTDAAIVDIERRMCLVLELKSFIEPAEPLETTHRAQELAKGLAQLRALRDLFTANAGLRSSVLDVPEDIEVFYVLASENWIGDACHQDPTIPIIQLDHLLSKVTATRDLREVVSWLRQRNYLPVEGADFAVRRVTREIAGWYLDWYGTKPLAERLFLPGV